MNLLFTTAGELDSGETRHLVSYWRSRHQIVAPMPWRRLPSYLRFDPASSLALVDAIVCDANIPLISWDKNGDITPNYPLETGLYVAEEVHDLPSNCAMRDGRMWKSLPFIIFPGYAQYEIAELAKPQTHAHLEFIPHHHPAIALYRVRRIVDEYQDRVLAEYRSYGILVRFENGHVQIGPALRKKNPNLESDYYFAPADRRKNKNWVTARRDNQGLSHDVELFQQLLERNATELEIHAFFEQHPAFLMEARLGVPISHSPNFARPKDEKPDFALSPILGPFDGEEIALLELKRPGEPTLNRGFHRGLSSSVKRAIDQIRDYDRYLRDPANFRAIARAFGYIPQRSNLAVLIGRAPGSEGDKEVFMRRQSEVDVEIVTYDEILQTQASQLLNFW